jgi:hypothetical protein
MTDLWTFKDRVIAPIVILPGDDGDGPQFVRRIVFFCGFPLYRYHFIKDHSA